jgi:peptide/nickel transport system permease protein
MSNVATTTTTLAQGRVGRDTTPWWRFPKRWRNPIGIVGAIIVIVTILVALLAPLIAPESPDAQAAKRLLGPSGDNWMGTDELGRDTFSRIVYGSRCRSGSSRW